VGAIGHISGGLQCGFSLSSPDASLALAGSFSRNLNSSCPAQIFRAFNPFRLLSRPRSIPQSRCPAVIRRFQEFARSMTDNTGIHVPSLGSDRPGWPGRGLHLPLIISLTAVVSSTRSTARGDFRALVSWWLWELQDFIPGPLPRRI